jgi:subtilisin family serine protease
MNFFKLKHMVFVMFISLFFVACSGGGDTPSGKSYTVVDPYISGATFFWDKNKNGIKDSDEPLSTASDENGKFTFDIDLGSNPRIIMYDKGIHNGVDYTGILLADLSDTGVVSPLTTIKATQGDVSNVITKLKDAGIIISADDFDKDPMATANRTKDLVSATVAIDTFLKISNENDIIITADTLKDIAETTKAVLGDDTSDDNIDDLVRVVDRLVAKTKNDKNLDELTKLNTDDTYRNNVKNTLKNMSSPSEAALVHELGSDGSSYTFHYPIFENKIFSFTSSPAKGEETTLSLNLDDVSGVTINWSVVSQPTSSNLSLDKASDQKSVTFTPSEVGNYKIKVVAESSNAKAEKTTSFIVTQNLTMDQSNVQSVDSNESKIIGTVSNQSWVSSKSLDETKLTSLITDNYDSVFTKVGYDSSKGLLVEYTVGSSAKEALENLKLESGVDKVFNRVYTNDYAYGSYAFYPDDNGDFDDVGSNWHLEVINMPEAWEYTRGSDKFLLGVSDGGFDTKHEDLSGKFATILTSYESSHGMGVTGAMVAKQDNGKGITGINDKTNAVASYMGGSYVKDIIETKQDGKDVRLVSCSWGYHLPSNFDPTNATMAKERFEMLQSIYSQIRQLVTYYDNKLFLWAAGNGVGNGYSTTGYYGVDAKYDNGALHYKNNALDKLDNLLIVGAFVRDSKADDNSHQDSNYKNLALVYYSEYGQSVDIAAPTHFDSLALDNKIYKTFGGTSAATPVVSAVASLIYSINPNLTAKEVKNILISSATDYITQRQKNPQGDLEYLLKPLPILNAKEALKMAQETVEKKIIVRSEITDIITPTIDLIYTPSSMKYEVTSVETSVKSSDSQSNYIDLNNGSSQTNVVSVTLDPNKRYHKIDAVVTLKSIATGDTFTQSHTYYYSYSDMTIQTIDNVNLEPISSTSVTISKLDSNMSAVTENTDDNGTLKIYIDEGTYRLVGTRSGYADGVKDMFVKKDTSIQTQLPLTADTIENQGSISGYVYDEDGIALEDALVKISGGALTNGYFASVKTDKNGYYKLTNISKIASDDFDNDPIEEFTMSASKDGYVEFIRDGVIVLENKERVENFNLIAQSIIPEDEYIYKTDFEDNVSDWNATGMWHIQENNSSIVNVNIAKGNVYLAPDDNGTGKLPFAPSGSKLFWYGQEHTGSFIGEESSQYSQGGGKSKAKNSGTLISPLISIGDVNATLTFDNWWEIESVNPNVNGYDLLEIYVVVEDKNYSNKCDSDKSSWITNNTNKILEKFDAKNWNSTKQNKLLDIKYKTQCSDNSRYEAGDLVKKLNPAIDPVVSSRYSIPFSSGGFNRKPIWSKEVIDLSEYRGKKIRLKFKFNTVDSLYNGFRGWMIDDIKIFDKSKVNG